MNIQNALCFINRILKECKPEGMEWNDISRGKRARGLLILNQLYDLMVEQGEDPETIRLVNMSIDYYGAVLEKYASSSKTISVEDLYTVQREEEERRRQENMLRARQGRC